LALTVITALAPEFPSNVTVPVAACTKLLASGYRDYPGVSVIDRKQQGNGEQGT
jgi:hypothetical protein